MGVPVIDISPWTVARPSPEAHRRRDPDPTSVASAVDDAAREMGCFCVVGHGLRPGLLTELEDASRSFFSLPESEKALVSMDRGGRAWRGWFPLGGELTGGTPDRKEGIYFGRELPGSDPRVAAGVPLHGPNMFPRRPNALRPLVLEALHALEGLGRTLMAIIASALGPDAEKLATDLVSDPVILMRVFHYPALGAGRHDTRATPGGTGSDATARWGVGEHTDYGLLTLLHQDRTGGLEVRTGEGWVGVDPPPGALVCNLGDMMVHLTDGRYRATPHRVRVPREDRISIPFFLDPGWDVALRELRMVRPSANRTPGKEPSAQGSPLDGTYGDYLISKVSRVFPALRDAAGL